MTRIFMIFTFFVLAGLQVEAAPSETYESLSARLVGQAETALSRQDSDGANQFLNLALVADPANVRAYVLKGETLRRQGLAQEGLRLIGVGLDINPLHVEGLILQSQAALDVDNIEQAQTALARVAPLCADACAFASALADATARLGKMQTEE